MDTIDPEYSEVASVLKSTCGVGQLTSVECPVEGDQFPVGNVAPESDFLALRDVLIDRSRVEVEAILLFYYGIRVTSKHENANNRRNSFIHFLQKFRQIATEKINREQRSSSIVLSVAVEC